MVNALVDSMTHADTCMPMPAFPLPSSPGVAGPLDSKSALHIDKIAMVGIKLKKGFEDPKVCMVVRKFSRHGPRRLAVQHPIKSGNQAFATLAAAFWSVAFGSSGS